MSDTSNHYIGRKSPNTPIDPLGEMLKKVSFVAIVIILILLCSVFCSCKSTAPLYIETVQHDTLTQYVTQRDSVYLHDSIYHEVMAKGDTVFVTRDRWHTQYRDRWHHDSIYIAQIDTIHRTEVREVERELSAWDRFRIALGNLQLMAAFIFALFLALKAYFWRK